MIMDCRGLNEANRHMIPVGKLYDVFEPFDREPRQPDFELRQRGLITRQDIESDEGCASFIPAPPRPDRKTPVRFCQAPDEIVQCWPDRRFAGSNFMIAFATAEGLLLDIISDTSFSDASNAACIRAGAIWTENVCGTNGLGTAAYLKRPIVVHGREHRRHCDQRLGVSLAGHAV
jgi:hypothetical protein